MAAHVRLITTYVFRCIHVKGSWTNQRFAAFGKMSNQRPQRNFAAPFDIERQIPIAVGAAWQYSWSLCSQAATREGSWESRR